LQIHQRIKEKVLGIVRIGSEVYRKKRQVSWGFSTLACKRGLLKLVKEVNLLTGQRNPKRKKTHSRAAPGGFVKKTNGKREKDKLRSYKKGEFWKLS